MVCRRLRSLRGASSILAGFLGLADRCGTFHRTDKLADITYTHTSADIHSW